MNDSLYTCVRRGVPKRLNRPRRGKSHWERVTRPVSLLSYQDYFRRKLFDALKIPREYLFEPIAPMRMP